MYIRVSLTMYIVGCSIIKGGSKVGLKLMVTEHKTS